MRLLQLYNEQQCILLLVVAFVEAVSADQRQTGPQAIDLYPVPVPLLFCGCQGFLLGCDFLASFLDAFAHFL